MASQKRRLTYDDLVATLPTLEPEEQVNLLGALSAVLKKSVAGRGEAHSLLELEGLGAEVWLGLDVEQYIASERDSWN